MPVIRRADRHDVDVFTLEDSTIVTVGRTPVPMLLRERSRALTVYVAARDGVAELTRLSADTRASSSDADRRYVELLVLIFPADAATSPETWSRGSRECAS